MTSTPHKLKVNQIWDYKVPNTSCTESCCRHRRIITQIVKSNYGILVYFDVCYDVDNNHPKYNEYIHIKNFYEFCTYVGEKEIPRSGFSRFICNNGL